MGTRLKRLSILLVLLSASALAAQQRGLNPQAGGAIIGHVTDRDGRPVPGVLVTVMRQRTDRGVSRLSFVNPTLRQQTDRAGGFRLSGLAPGEYFAVAVPTQQPRTADGTPSRVGVGVTYFRVRREPMEHDRSWSAWTRRRPTSLLSR